MVPAVMVMAVWGRRKKGMYGALAALTTRLSDKHTTPLIQPAAVSLGASGSGGAAARPGAGVERHRKRG